MYKDDEKYMNEITAKLKVCYLLKCFLLHIPVYIFICFQSSSWLTVCWQALCTFCLILLKPALLAGICVQGNIKR